MRLARPLPTLLLCAAAIAGCGDGPIEPGVRPEPSFIRLESDAGDWVGAGRSYSYTLANARIDFSAEGTQIDVSVDGDEWWHGSFVMPNGTTRFRPGTYAVIQNYSTYDPAKGFVQWAGEGRGCGAYEASFTVDAVTYVGDSLAAIDLRFVQRCGEGAAALRGTIHWRADDTTRAPGPVLPVPSNLWQPPAGVTPATGDYVYLQSDQGDYIGQGGNYLYAEPTTPITVTSNGGGQLAVQVGQFGGWHGDFVTMAAISRFEPGYYGGLQRWPFHNPMKGGLDWSGNGRGCNELTGWFVVDSVTYVGVALTAIELRFEQHCEGGTPALRGKIRWTA